MPAPVKEQMSRVSSRDIQVGGLIGERLDLTWRGNLLALDWDRDFLQPFRDKSAEGGYVGLGKTLDGLVHFAAYTKNPKLLTLKHKVVDTLVEAQLPDGYLGWYVPAARIVKLWDIHEMAYILFALVSDYRYCDEERSLRAAVRLGDYFLNEITADRLKAISENWPCVELSTIGLDRAMLALHQTTGYQRYFDFCVRVQDLPHWNLPVVEGRHGKIEGHVYAFLTKCLAQLEMYEITGEATLLTQTHKALDFLRRQFGLVITGSCSQTECWHSDQRGTGDLGETCTTGYLIRIMDKLLRLEADSRYGDIMERAVYNALFAAQSPDGRRLRYYVPFEGERIYWDRDTYCCPGNFRRIMSELPEMIYYVQDGGLTVNLYAASGLETEVAPGLSMSVRQETEYPNDGAVRLHVNPSNSATFPVRLRVPAWCNGFAVSVNGELLTPPQVRGFLVIEREWRRGDVIELEMETPWRLVRGFREQEGRVAVMRGPMLFCLNPEVNPKAKNLDLKAITLDPSLLQTVEDHTIRPGGIACRVKAWRNADVIGEPDLDLRLTEFADPGGVATYFRVSDTAGVADSEQLLVDDELLEL